MPIKLTEKNKKERAITFVWKKTNPAFVNTIRRLIINEVPTMAIDEITFKKNSSVLYDEILAHRLGLIPIKTDLKSYILKEKCKCEGAGCARCTLKFTLAAKSEGILYSSKLKSQDPKSIPVFEDIPIVKLEEGQQIQIEATAVLGRGKTHAKFSPGLVYYRHYPTIEFSKKIESPKKIAELCPKRIFEAKGDSLSLTKDRIELCNLCYSCVDASKGEVSVIPDPESFIITIESFGQLEPKEMLLRAADVFDEYLEELAEKIEALPE